MGNRVARVVCGALFVICLLSSGCVRHESPPPVDVVRTWATPVSERPSYSIARVRRGTAGRQDSLGRSVDVEGEILAKVNAILADTTRQVVTVKFLYDERQLLRVVDVVTVRAMPRAPAPAWTQEVGQE